MAMIDMSSNNGWYLALAPLAGWPETPAKTSAGTFKELAVRFLGWRARRETVRILNRLDAATLRDLGIADIESQVYGAPQDRRRGYDPEWWKKRTVK
jgi:uncharacterized protein YjiS (DUF1127 family)